MPIPSHQACMLPVLELLADGEEHRTRDVIESVADAFSLTPQERDELIPSGKQRLIANRVGWARTYLKKAGLLEYPRRGSMRITARGKELLAERPAKIDRQLLDRYAEFRSFRSLRRPRDAAGNDSDRSSTTPEEALEAAHSEIRADLESDLLDVVKSCSPAFFERVVVDLLVKMGYGGSADDAGQVLGQRGDEGVDGVIKEDRLGLDVVYVQGKRWDHPVSRPEIQKLAGALQGKRARKGVFLTTSTFSKEARRFARDIETSIVLVDGAELARLMADFGLGVSTVATYELKRIDAAYFEDDG